jgi:antitoxin component YwqK of YwqJK toxin-antitoxin module
MRPGIRLTIVVTLCAIAAMVCITSVSAASSAKKQQPNKKIVVAEGRIVEDSAGNKSGTMTIKTNKAEVELFYEFGKFKINGADSFQQGDVVSASYKPVKADYDGELVSITIKSRKK